jgi:hypothetical protein
LKVKMPNKLPSNKPPNNDSKKSESRSPKTTGSSTSKKIPVNLTKSLQNESLHQWSSEGSKMGRVESTSDSVLAELQSESRELILGDYQTIKRKEKEDKFVVNEEMLVKVEEDQETRSGKPSESKRTGKGVQLLVQREHSTDTDDADATKGKGLPATGALIKKALEPDSKRSASRDSFGRPVKRVRSETDLINRTKILSEPNKGTAAEVAKVTAADANKSSGAATSKGSGSDLTKGTAGKSTGSKSSSTLTLKEGQGVKRGPEQLLDDKRDPSPTTNDGGVEAVPGVIDVYSPKPPIVDPSQVKEAIDGNMKKKENQSPKSIDLEGTKSAVITLKINPSSNENSASVNVSTSSKMSPNETDVGKSIEFSTGSIPLGKAGSVEEAILAGHLTQQLEEIERLQSVSPTSPTVSPPHAPAPKTKSAALSNLLQTQTPVDATLQPPTEASLSISLTRTPKSATADRFGQSGSAAHDRGRSSHAPCNASTNPVCADNPKEMLSDLFSKGARAVRSGSTQNKERKLCPHCNAMHCEYCGCRPMLVAIIIICIGLCLYLKYNRS